MFYYLNQQVKKCKKCNENIYEDEDFCVQPDGTYLCTQCIWEENNLQRILNENK
jgi:formylmethanofuran dehydrogenase subunit E